MTATPSTGQRLFDLLPMVHRLRDPEHGRVLRDLMDLLAEQVDVLGEELDQLYDDQFIETCADWAAAYIGDVVGYRVLHGVVPSVASPRAEVANTIGYRRRKGTAAVLEQLARDVTGWPARAVEFFERVTTTQYLNHVRPHAAVTPHLHRHEALGWVASQNGAFDDLAHTPDVRRIAADRPGTPGRHNIPNVGIFLWRIEAVPVARSLLVEHADRRRYRIDPLGMDAPLFSPAASETDITHLATPREVPLPLGRRYLADHLGAFYGRGRALLLERRVGNGEPTPVPLAAIRICDLSDDGADWAHRPPAGAYAIDPVLGRVHAGTPLANDEALLSSYAFGRAVPIGAGGALRDVTVPPQPLVSVSGGQITQGTLDGIRTGGTLRISDSLAYAGNPTVRTTTAAAGDPDTVVVVQAADGERPSLVATTMIRLQLEPRTTVVLDGLLVSGGPLVLEEAGDKLPRTVVLRNCTLVPGTSRTGDGDPAQPGRASVLLLDPFATLRVESSVIGPVVAVEGSRVESHDSAVDATTPTGVAICGRPPVAGGLRTVGGLGDLAVGDGTTPAGEVDLHETTVVGGIHCTQLDASNSILLAELAAADPRPVAVHARRRQVGCVRYSYVPEGSRTGKRYRCAPDPKAPTGVRRATTPRFTSLRFGDPAYLQLATTTPDAIRRGADDESEMGATHLLFTPAREANLMLRLDEYLRFGLEAGFFYAT